jgi:hypothetical protein
MQLFSVKTKKQDGVSSQEKKLTKSQRLLSPSSLNLFPLFVLGTLGLQGLLFLQTTFNTLWIAKLARRPAPTLVELVDGRSIQVGAEASLYRSPQAIKQFVGEIATMLFTASGTVAADPMAPKRDVKPKLDPGVEIAGSGIRGKKKVTSAAWEASFALSEDFRATFLAKMAEITPPGAFSGTAQTMLAISYLSEPEPLEPGKWRVKMVANLYTFMGGDRLGQAVPVNKEVYVKAVYVQPQPLSESATEIQRAVYNARASGLEIYRFGELAAASDSPTSK